MAKAISIFAVLFLCFLVALETVPRAEATDECKKEYEGDATDFQLCGPLIYPSFCFRRCISENGAKGGNCKTGKCVCDFCHEPDECLKKYDGEETDFQLCAPLIYPPFCHQFCKRNNGAKGGRCTADGCLCDFCINPYPDIIRANAA